MKQSAVCAAAQGKHFKFPCNLLMSKNYCNIGTAQYCRPVHWMEKYVTQKKCSVVLGGRVASIISILLSGTDVCKCLVMRICMSKYHQPLSAIIPDRPYPSHNERSTLLCSARVLGVGFICCACGLMSGSYGASGVLDGTDR